MIWGEDAGRASSKIDGVEERIEARAGVGSQAWRMGYVVLQVGNVPVKKIAGKNSGGKVAEGTLGPAEGDRKIKRGMDGGVQRVPAGLV